MLDEIIKMLDEIIKEKQMDESVDRDKLRLMSLVKEIESKYTPEDFITKRVTADDLLDILKFRLENKNIKWTKDYESIILPDIQKAIDIFLKQRPDKMINALRLGEDKANRFLVMSFVTMLNYRYIPEDFISKRITAEEILVAMTEQLNYSNIKSTKKDQKEALALIQKAIQIFEILGT